MTTASPHLLSQPASVPVPAPSAPRPTPSGGRAADPLREDAARSLMLRHTWGVLSTVHDGRPYAVPVSYGLATDCLYIATGPGKKLRALQGEPAVCLTITEVVDGSHWSCVVVTADAVPIRGVAERLTALDAIRRQQTRGRTASPRDLARAARATVFRLVPLEISVRACP